jgi:hypothetical protein
MEVGLVENTLAGTSIFIMLLEVDLVNKQTRLNEKYSNRP